MCGYFFLDPGAELLLFCCLKTVFFVDVFLVALGDVVGFAGGFVALAKLTFLDGDLVDCDFFFCEALG